MFCRKPYISVVSVVLLCISGIASACVTNPDISVIGQIVSNYTNDAQSENANTPTLDLGEIEIMIDSYLNPYAKGTFVFSIENDRFTTEEAYISSLRGLPNGLAVKAGKYRVGFGKLNQDHRHNYPFIETPRVMFAMLPGDDGFNETGVQASLLLPTQGTWASMVSADILNGASFHPDETKSSRAWMSHWSNSFLIHDTHPLELGVSATQGTNNVHWNTKTQVLGGDIKTKIAVSNNVRITIQGEYFYNNSDVIVSTTTGSFDTRRISGFYAFTNVGFAQRYNAGIIYDQYQTPEHTDAVNRTIKCFFGYSLLEETTLFRLAYERFSPDGATPVDTVMFQVLFSMGPHKAHQF